MLGGNRVFCRKNRIFEVHAPIYSERIDDIIPHTNLAIAHLLTRFYSLVPLINEAQLVVSETDVLISETVFLL